MLRFWSALLGAGSFCEWQWLAPVLCLPSRTWCQSVYGMPRRCVFILSAVFICVLLSHYIWMVSGNIAPSPAILSLPVSPVSHLLDLVDPLRCFCSNLSPTVKWMHLSILWLLFPQLWEFVGTEHSENPDIQDYQSVVFVLERMPSWICNFWLGLYLLKYFKYLKEMLYWLRAQVATV